MRRRRAPRPSSRTRKAYAITAGRRLFSELLTDESDDDERAFALKFSFCRYLTPPTAWRSSNAGDRS